MDAIPYRGTQMLWQSGSRAMTAFTLQELALRVKERAAASPDVSYTRKLDRKSVV